jgi:hypothetical protein
MDVRYRFDDEVKDDAHGAFTSEMSRQRRVIQGLDKSRRCRLQVRQQV